MNDPFPHGGDRAAILRWMRERRGPTNPRSAPLTHEGLVRDQRDRLLALAGLAPEPESAQSSFTLDVALDGPGIVRHTAPIGLLGGFLTSLQNTVTAVAQALDGTPTVAGQVPGHISTATLLRSAPAFPSSHGLHLYGPDTTEPEWEQATLGLGEDRPPRHVDGARLLPDAVKTLMDITDLAQNAGEATPANRLMDHLVPLGQRALGHLATLSGTLSAHNTDLRMVCRPGTGEARASTLSGAAATGLKRLSEDVRYAEPRPALIEGDLVEASLRRGVVVIQLGSGGTITARMDPHVTEQLREHPLGTRLSANASVTVARYAGGRERELWRVTALRAAPEPPARPTRRRGRGCANARA